MQSFNSSHATDICALFSRKCISDCQCEGAFHSMMQEQYLRVLRFYSNMLLQPAFWSEITSVFFVLYVSETWNGIYACYITSIIFPCMVHLKIPINAQSNITVPALKQSFFFCHACCRSHNILVVHVSFLWEIFFLENGLLASLWYCHHHGDLILLQCTEYSNRKPFQIYPTS
jgi:hypothetical protein